MASRDGEEPPLRRPESCMDQPVDSSVQEVVSYAPSLLPASHYDPDTTEPISSGIRTMEELLSWRRGKASPFNVAAVPRAPREPPLDQVQHRTLVSHDMMGGYLDDRFVQGAAAEAPYTFYHWLHIDIFNYFSHQLVTVPPAVWTNAAHRHGVLTLGTFITEWTEGASLCEAFLKDEESYRAVADKLVQISHWYRFDGWLVNIENILSAAAVRNTPLFLRYLTDQMHERVGGSLVLWYDSVIQDGQLKWQNELNQTNRMFFDACDGMFTNYNWTEQNLEWMEASLGLQRRQADVYVGVDVFGRGKVVGGMFETNKALGVIRKHNFSTAIFAPGWVYEVHSDKKEFRKNQDRFWSLLSPYLPLHRPASPLPFLSSFCQGFGKAVYCRGQPEAVTHWFNLAAQELQPLYYRVPVSGGGWLSSSGCPEDAWNGGSSLLLEGLIPAAHHAPLCVRIFSLHVPLASRTLVTLVFKVSAGVSVSLELQTTDSSHCSHLSVQEVTMLDDGHQLVQQMSQLCGDWNTSGWTVRCSLLEVHGCMLREICVKISRDRDPADPGHPGYPADLPFSCRLGELMVLDAATLQLPPHLVQGLCIEEVVWLRGVGASPDSAHSCLLLNATLRWDYPPATARHFRVYWRCLRGPDPRIPPGRLALVGRAYATLFRVTELVVPEPPGLLELVVEPVVRGGFLVPERQWGRRSLSYTQDTANR